jgi:molybdopterin-guanine dinucleotide biosynthesis protein A
MEGPLASLTAGLRWAQSRGAAFLLTLPCDAPFLPVDLVGRLRARIDASASAIPSSGGQLHPTCGLWRVSADDQLAPYLKTGRRSLVGFAEWSGHAVEPWEGAPRDPFFNVNTPEDLARAEAWLSQPHFE